jgi:hypothetical protein
MREEDLKGVNRDLKAKDCQEKQKKNENLQKGKSDRTLNSWVRHVKEP